MKKIVLMLIVFCMCSAVFAEQYNVGPYPNYNGVVQQGFGITIPTTTDFYINDPFGNAYHIASRGGQVVDVTYDAPVFAASYAELESSESSPFNGETGSLILTEIWTWNMDPGAPPEVMPLLRGFEPGQPAIRILEPGFYEGKSGVQYWTGPPEAVMVRDLPMMLDGYDTGMIMDDPPGGIVFVTQAVVPAWDIADELPPCEPFFLIASSDQWQEKLDAEWPGEFIEPMSPVEWDDYMLQWGQVNYLEGLPYPDTNFSPAELYVYGGDDEPGDDEPDDAGLVMVWGEDDTPAGNHASAWKFDYGLDPDLSNSVLTVTAIPPGPSGINAISIGLKDINGNIRSWWWQVPGAIPYNVPTTITVDLTQTGVGAANPVASGYTSNPAFDISKVQTILADENAAWVGGPNPVPAPGQTITKIWNYWNNLSVTPKLPGGGANSKWYVKYTQAPVEVEPGLILGWDEVSEYRNGPILADDWECKDKRPITDIHWWGSFKGWTQPALPAVLPKAFHIGIWTDVPAGADGSFSHPGKMVWENYCDSSIWNFAGYDLDPRIDDPDWQENEACFQFAQFLSQDEWFWQEPMEDGMPNIYWLSIAAIYEDGVEVQYPWGWKTRPHQFMDDAVRIFDTDVWPPVVGAGWTGGQHVFLVDETGVEVSWDLAFELTTNEDDPNPGPGNADLNHDNWVDLSDLAIFAQQWLTAGL